jgi:hypothetical protein
MPTADPDQDPPRSPGARIRALGWWPAFVLAIAWFAVGIFPCAPVEGDDLAISVGAHGLVEYGTTELAYRYDAQPGTYVLIAAGRLVGLQTHRAFCLLTAVSFAAFVCLSAVFISHTTRLAVPLCGLVLLLFQEVWTTAYFANSNMPSAALIAASLVVASRGTGRKALTAAAALLAAAAWLRLDAVLIGPAFALLILRDRERRLERLAVAGAVFAITLSLLLVASGASVFAMFFEYGGHLRNYVDVGRTIASYSTVLTAFTLVLMVLGSWRLVANRDYWTLAMVAAGVTPAILMYGLSLTTPKYLLTSLIYIAIPTAVGIEAVRWSRKRLLLVPLLATLFALQYLIDPSPVFGRSCRVETHDGVRYLAELMRSPSRWSRRKQCTLRAIRDVDRAIDQLLAASSEPVILSDGWLPSRIVLYRLLDAHDPGQPPAVRGYEAREVRFVFGERSVIAIRVNPGDGEGVTPALLTKLGLGSGSRFLLVSKSRSPKSLPPEAITTRLGRDRPAAWLVELP